MRGFPLVGALVVLVVFGISWPVLQATIGDRAEVRAVDTVVEEADAVCVNAGSAELVSIHVLASAEMTRLRIDYLGEPLADEALGQTEFEGQLVDIALPREGIDFWVEAQFAENPHAAEGGAPIALRLEVEDAEGEVYQRTLWSDGEPGIADSVFIQPTEGGQ